VATDWRGAGLGAVDRALCELAARMTHGQHGMGPRDLEPLRALGLEDRAIHDTVQVAAYFNYITRIADALGVELDEHIPLRGPGR
jgi:alkylhydroperoxidase family enzyme